MKKLWLLLAIVVTLQSIHPQEVKHVPTVEQCRVDMSLCRSKLEQEPERSGVAYVGYGELENWFNDMYDCESVDPELSWLYYNTGDEVSNEQHMRMKNYLDRHHLYSQFLASPQSDLKNFLDQHHLYGQFLAEDAQGKR
jgi:hypothetical protein